MPAKGRLLPREFYLRDAVEVARDLLGQVLWRDAVAVRITETEAYRADDTACHARFGMTARNRVMWEEGGRAYVYLCYGLHHMLNIVTGERGKAAAVLIRAAEPVAGLSTIQKRRGGKHGPELLSGPGKVAAALDLDTSFSGQILYKRGSLELREADKVQQWLVGPRVGIDYANSRDRKALWRFAVADSNWVSQRKSLRQLKRDAIRQ